MKKLLLLLGFFFVLKANAQNYLINFTGIGASTNVSTVKVENLASHTTYIIEGGDILRLTGVTGVNSIEIKQESEILIYPNPTTGDSRLQIFPPVEGSAVIAIFDISGKTIVQTHCYLENYLQEFQLSSMRKGVYIITVRGINYQYSGKLVCLGQSVETVSIDKISSKQVVPEKPSKKGSKGVQAIIDMPYNTGERLKFTGISGNFSTVFMDIPAESKTIAFDFVPCTDFDNNNYSVVKIGTQTWMAENLKSTHFRNGTSIPDGTGIGDYSGQTAPKYYFNYDDNVSNVLVYGRLYTWFAATNENNICPTGWHLPAFTDFTTLESYLIPYPGGKMKEMGLTHWSSPNDGATNQSGFSGLPGGSRSAIWVGGGFNGKSFNGNWWSANELNSTNARGFSIGYLGPYLNRFDPFKLTGYSIRCIKD